MLDPSSEYIDAIIHCNTIHNVRAHNIHMQTALQPINKHYAQNKYITHNIAHQTHTQT